MILPFLCFTVNGQGITWQHICDLVDKIYNTSIASHGLSLVPKLKQEHINLTSYSRMRVDLAAQVIKHCTIIMVANAHFVISLDIK